MKCIISITKLSNLTLIYTLLLFILKSFSDPLKKKINNILYNKNSSSIYFFISLIFMYLGECLYIFIFIIRYIMNKNKKNKKEELDKLNNEKIVKKEDINFIFYLNSNNNYHNFYSFFPFGKKDYKNILILLLIFLFDFIISMFLINYGVDFYGVSGLSGLLLFKFLFKYQIYKHHLLSIFILIISSLVQIIISFFEQSDSKEKDKKKYIIFTLYEIFYNICIGFFFILIKYLIDIKNIDYLIILILEGIFGLIISNLYYLIFKYNTLKVYIKIIFSLGLNDYFYLVFFLICISIYNLLIIKLIEKAPSIYSLLIINMVVYFSHLFFCDIKEHLKGLLIITFILNIINIIAMLIFIEFFVLNFCGLNYNCKINIEKREIEEKKNLENEEDVNNNNLFKEDDI